MEIFAFVLQQFTVSERVIADISGNSCRFYDVSKIFFFEEVKRLCFSFNP